MKAIDREIGRIALPAIVTNVTIPLLGLVDTAIAGHIAGDGALYIGAVAVGTMMFNLIYWCFEFLRMGTVGITAQACGSGDRTAQVRVLQNATVLALLIAVGVLALQVPLRWVTLLAIGPTEQVRTLSLAYFNIVVWGAPPTLAMMGIKGWMLGMQDSRGPMVISIGVNVLNIIISLVCVYGLGMGFNGIAVGTLVAEWLGLALSLWLLCRGYRWLPDAVNWREALRLKGARRFFSVNAFIFLRSTLVMAVTLTFVAVGARSGNLVLAVNSLMMQLFTLYSYFVDGLAFAAEAIVGRCHGAHDRRGVGRCVRRLFGWGTLLMLLFAVAYAVFPHFIYSLLTSNAQVVALAMRLRWWCVAIPVAGLAAFLWDGVFIGLTRTRAMTGSMLAAASAFFAILAVTPAAWGDHALWLAFITYLALRGLVQTAQYARLRF